VNWITFSDSVICNCAAVLHTGKDFVYAVYVVMSQC